VQAVGAALSELRAQAPASGDPEARALAAALDDLEQLRPAYLRACELHQRLSRSLAQGTDRYREEIARLTALHAAEKDLGLKLELRQTINAAQREIDQHARLDELRRALELRVSQLEHDLSHLRSLLLSGAAPSEARAEAERLLLHVGGFAALETQS
jgi:hypothetical protein